MQLSSSQKRQPFGPENISGTNTVSARRCLSLSEATTVPIRHPLSRDKSARVLLSGVLLKGLIDGLLSGVKVNVVMSWVNGPQAGQNTTMVAGLMNEDRVAST